MKNKSSTLMLVPILQPVSIISGVLPPLISTLVPKSLPGSRVSMVKRDTEAMVGKASPRNPMVEMLLRSDTS